MSEILQIRKLIELIQKRDEMKEKVLFSETKNSEDENKLYNIEKMIELNSSLIQNWDVNKIDEAISEVINESEKLSSSIKVIGQSIEKCANASSLASHEEKEKLLEHEFKLMDLMHNYLSESSYNMQMFDFLQDIKLKKSEENIPVR